MRVLNGQKVDTTRNEERPNARRYPILESSIQVDVAILGSGLTAIQAALELHKSGLRVALVAPDELVSSVNVSLGDLLDIGEPSNHSRWLEELGLEKGSLVAAAYRASIGELHAKSRKYPECHFTSVPTFNVAEHVGDLLAIERECAMGRALNGDCWFVREVQLPFRCAGASRDNQQCKLQTAPLLRAMISEFQMLGGEVYEHSPCLAPPNMGRVCKVTTERGRIVAANVLFAGRMPQAGMSPPFPQVMPVHSYIIAARADRPIGEAIYVLGDEPRRMVWRSDRTDPSRIIIRTDYHGSQIESQPQRLDELCCYGASRFSLKRVDHKWSHHRLCAVDGLPIAGRIPHLENAYLAMGMGPMEIPWGIACGNLLGQMIRGESSPLGAVFDPERVTKAPSPSAGHSSLHGGDHAAAMSVGDHGAANGIGFGFSSAATHSSFSFRGQGMSAPYVEASRRNFEAEAWRGQNW